MNVSRNEVAGWRKTLAILRCLVLVLLPFAKAAGQGLPSGWTDGDIGSPGIAGMAADTDGGWTVAGGGSDIWNAADQFNFASENFTGNGSIIAQVLTVENTDPSSGWSKVGVMLRNDSTPGSANAGVVVTAGNGVSFQWRAAANGEYLYQNIPGLTAPMWIKLTRAGTNFSAYYSEDGQSWTQVGATEAITMATSLLAGIATTAHNNAALNTSTVTNVSVSFGGLPAGWTDVDIGSPAKGGSASYTNGQWIVTGGGADIGGTSDQFNLASEDFSDIGSIDAKVLSLKNSDATTGLSKAGIMLRNDVTAGAVNAGVFDTFSNGVIFQWRSATGGGTSNVTVPGLKAPIWLRLSRQGNSVGAFYSEDGAAWTEVGAAQNLGLNGQILAGLAVTAHNNYSANTGNFTNVVVTSSNAPVVVSPPAVANSPAANVQATAATLGGQITGTGNENPEVTLFYGPSDGGTNAGAWASSIFLGPKSGYYFVSVTGLATNATYYFTSMASNSAGVAWATPSVSFTTLSNLSLRSLLTFHYDNTRAGANTNETILTPANVNVNNFGKLFTYNVDGFVFAQALVATNVSVPGEGVHNILYVVTENDTVYAFDADNYVPTPYWTNSFINAAAGVYPVPGGDANGNIYPEIGITATPVIDPTSGTIYVEARTKEIIGPAVVYAHRLHALDIATGKERTNYNSPVLIECTNYPGAGTPGQNDTDGGGHVLWNGLREQSRAALLLSQGVVYIAYASPGDHPPYYGWVFGYDARTLALKGAYNDEPNAGYGGIWMTGNGMAADTNGSLYFSTGNGTNDANNDYGDSVMKLSATNGLQLADYFTPYNQETLWDQDLDVASAGLLLLPDAAGTPAHRHLLLSGSKTGALFLLDRDNMGHFTPNADTQIVGELNGAVGGMWCSPAYFNGMFYIIGSGDVLKSFSLTNAAMGTTPTAQSAIAFGSSTPAITANGAGNAIVWALDSSAAGSSGPAVLHAFNATNVAQELYNSSQNSGRDAPGSAVEFTLPAIVNGKVYVGGQYSMSVFGNATFLATPTISPNAGTFSESVTVTLADATPGAAIYYTLDGSTPGTNSIRYTASFILTNTASVRVIAVKPGYLDSSVVSAGFLNSSSIGSGTGLLGEYYANQIGTFNAPATLTRIDPTIDFIWPNPGNGPDPTIGETDFSVDWTGCVQPQFNETYTFSITVDDGGRLFINGQEIINGWQDQAPTTYSASVPMNAQQFYNIEFQYYQRAGGAEAELAWSSPSTANQIISETQLHPFTNPPPAVVLSSPTNDASYGGNASVTFSASADALSNDIQFVTFYANGVAVGSVSNLPYILTVTGLSSGSYALDASATDGSGLASTSAVANIVVNPGSGLPYGLTTRAETPAFFNMPAEFAGAMPTLLSQTGVFSDTPNMTPAAGLIPYAPNVQLWSDGAVKTRWLALPYDGGIDTSDQQVGFAPTGQWTFPTGTIFVKHFALATNQINPSAPPRRLETRLIVRNPEGAVYGVTYKWRPDYSDADLLTSSSNEVIPITTANGMTNQTWYYPSPSDCLQCHTTVANYVLGVNTRQLNGNLTYPTTGVTDNQLRTWDQLGLFNPSFDEASITNFAQMAAVTNQSATLEKRSRSYIDANCSQCHQPGGTGPSFDARFDTPLANQNIINGAVIGNLGYDNAHVVTPRDVWRSILYQRADSLNPTIKMPALARNLVDTNAMSALAAWINSLPGTNALAPPAITPAGGRFFNNVGVSLQPPDGNAAIYYTLDGSLPTTNSFFYSGVFNLTSNATVSATAFESNYINSVAASGSFFVLPEQFLSESHSNGVFQMQFGGVEGSNYVLQGSTNLVNWTPLVTNPATANTLNFVDPGSSNLPSRFYRVFQQ